MFLKKLLKKRENKSAKIDAKANLMAMNDVVMPVDITCFPFRTLKTSQKNAFVVALSSQSKKQNKGLLANQGIQDLYELSRYLQRRLLEDKHELKNSSKSEAKDIKRRIKMEKRLLRQARSRFNLRITRNKATFKMIAANSKRYLKQQNKNPGFLSKCYNLIKAKLDMLFTRGKFTNNYLNIYDNHDQYQKSINILTYDFPQLTTDQQKTFLQLLVSQTPSNQDLILQSQSLPGLNEIKQLTEENNVIWVLFSDKAKRTANHQDCGLLHNKLKAILDNVAENIEQRYSAIKYGETTDPLRNLMFEYLRANRHALKTLMDFSGVTRDHLETPDLQISILPNYDHNYDVRVSLPTGGFSQPVSVPRQEALILAWAQLALDQKGKLCDALAADESLRSHVNSD